VILCGMINSNGIFFWHEHISFHNNGNTHLILRFVIVSYVMPFFCMVNHIYKIVSICQFVRFVCLMGNVYCRSHTWYYTCINIFDMVRNDEPGYTDYRLHKLYVYRLSYAVDAYIDSVSLVTKPTTSDPGNLVLKCRM
jgi:hypothetical protein